MRTRRDGIRSDVEPVRLPDGLGSLSFAHLNVGGGVYVVYDTWRQRDRVVRYRGTCVVCGHKTWSFDDGENDPRGMLGDNALWISTFGDDEVEVRTCAICANDYDRYRAAERILRERGTVAVRPIMYTEPFILPGAPVEDERCADCGEVGEMTGHMGCMFPKDHP